MNRRLFLYTGILSLFAGACQAKTKTYPFMLSDAEWRKKLTPIQYNILRKEGTEPSYTSKLLNEKRKGIYFCIGCDNPLFKSETKYDSGTGWPSFNAPISGALLTSIDYLLGDARTEYHCAKCGGHHGHVFDDGPMPTGLRYCSNGAVLKFQEA